MNWGLSILVALLSGTAGLFASGWVTSLHAGWHQLPNREGAVGYLIVFMALLGGVAAFVAGLVIARMVAAGSDPGFFKAAGSALGLVAGLAGLVLVVSRLTADIPPTIEGRPLVLEIELRLPVGAVPPREREGSPRFELGSVVGGTRRDSVYGTLHLDRAREEGGRWILPASAELFTSRGQRSIEAHLGDECLGRFLVPLPAHPGKEHEAWSDWMPHPRPGDPPWPDTEPSFRHRVRISGNS
jgi:hypothetical protein